MTGSELRGMAERGDPLIAEMAARYVKFGAGDKITSNQCSLGFSMMETLDDGACIFVSIGHPQSASLPRSQGRFSSISIVLSTGKGFVDLFWCYDGIPEISISTPEAIRVIDKSFEILAKELDPLSIDASEALLMSRVADALDQKLKAS